MGAPVILRLNVRYQAGNCKTIRMDKYVTGRNSLAIKRRIVECEIITVWHTKPAVLSYLAGRTIIAVGVWYALFL